MDRFPVAVIVCFAAFSVFAYYQQHHFPQFSGASPIFRSVLGLFAVSRSEDAPRGARAMRMRSVTSVVVCLALLLGCGDRTRVDTSRADLIVVGDVHTMNASAPRAEAIAVARGRLVFVGDGGRARALLRPDGRTVELAPGQIVLPGLVDAHVHMLEAGVFQLG